MPMEGTELRSSGFRWMEFLPLAKTAVKYSLLGTLAQCVETEIGLKPEDHDLIMLKHTFVIEWVKGKTVRPTVLYSITFS